MPVTAIIVGAGHRAMSYAAYSKLRPDDLKIVGVAEPDPYRRAQAVERYQIPDHMVFNSAEELARQDKLADSVINGTMDHLHVETSLPLIELGYDILLEKPIAVNALEMQQLNRAAEAHKTRILVCHVLRYAPFYQKIKTLIHEGVLGDIIHLHLAEHVAYHHLLVAYVRGKWADRYAAHSPMLLAKSSHDLDLMCWLKGVEPETVSSFGSDFQFRPENAPPGAADRCLPGCIYQDTCNYSVKNLHVKQQIKRSYYVWDEIKDIPNANIDDLKHSLETDNIYGICAWKTGRNNVDHQVVNVNFADGATGTLDMIGGTSRAQRKIHVVGTEGEIEGTFDDGIFTLRTVAPFSEDGYEAQVINIADHLDPNEAYDDGHGGGDALLMQDFVNYVRGEETSISGTTLADSIDGHAVAFAADIAMQEKRLVDLSEVLG